MSELRDLVIDAHGDIARWNKVKTIEGDMSITDGLWARKGWPDVLKNVRVTAATVAGGAPTAHYLSDHRDFDGIKVATKRQALRRKADGTALPDPVFVAIDIAQLSFS